MSLRKEQPGLEQTLTKTLEAKGVHMLRGLIEGCVSESSMIRSGRQNIRSTEEGSSDTQLPSTSALRPGPSTHNRPNTHKYTSFTRRPTAKHQPTLQVMEMGVASQNSILQSSPTLDQPSGPDICILGPN